MAFVGAFLWVFVISLFELKCSISVYTAIVNAMALDKTIRSGGNILKSFGPLESMGNGASGYESLRVASVDWIGNAEQIRTEYKMCFSPCYQAHQLIGTTTERR